MSLLRRHPGASLVLVEKESAPARHQTGHNSGVIHSGIYYAPGSLKADLCRRGEHATKEFCAEHGIPVEPTGKLLVATDQQDLARLADLQERARVNGIAAEPLSAHELREREPNVTGLAALLVRATGTVDYRRVCAAMVDDVRAAGGDVRYGATVTSIVESAAEVTVVLGASPDDDRIRANRLVVCAGLQADRLALAAGLDIRTRIVPFRGEYFALRAERAGVVQHHIYPVPDPSMPFLGVHLTRTVDGGVTLGPNAVLGLAREGYRKGSVHREDVADILRFPGFWRFARRHVRIGATELRNSLFTRGYLELVRRYVPDIELADLRPYPAGIRAQAMTRTGELLHDFEFAQTARMVHVLNAPSPAATSAIPIGDMIADRCTTVGAR